jgi:LuxR family transcriptional regulator, maltose regulon positive regulatory protein
LGRAYLASARQRFDDAISTLTGLKDDVERVQNHHFALRVGIRLCMARFSANRTAEALDELRRVLNVSAQAGIHQTFLDEGPKIGALLMAFRKLPSGRGNWPSLCLTSPAWSPPGGHGINMAAPSPKSGLADPLSAREGAILKLIAQGLSNKEIARSLAIRPETEPSESGHAHVRSGTSFSL